MKSRALLLGHRGARRNKSAPENTLAAFDLALESGCDGFEFDVRLTKDNQCVVCHDPKSYGRVVARSSAQQLGLPLLCEILARYRKTAFLDIELKVPGLEPLVTELLQKLPPKRGYVVSSFLPNVISSIHSLNDTIALGLICESEAQLRRWPELPVEYVFAQRSLASRECVRQIKDAGRKVFVWTVNRASEMTRFSDWEVDGIISDDPARLVRTLRS
jgi:glycerophosphoryl diester phosphodiesterase